MGQLIAAIRACASFRDSGVKNFARLTWIAIPCSGVNLSPFFGVSFVIMPMNIELADSSAMMAASGIDAATHSARSPPPLVPLTTML
jgi:hypothetical protein